MASRYARRFGVEEASEAVSRAAIKLGYSHLKDKQYQAEMEFVSGRHESSDRQWQVSLLLCGPTCT